tara:strand:+ start:28 stop:285 length:258 start_codon:yes stop_codon:yes gene_type:complete
MFTLTEFADYVWEFYSPNSDLYPIKSLTIEDVFHAIDIYFSRIKEAESNNGRWFNVTYSWGGGDTLDRERVRDIILEQPQFTFGG